MNRMKRGSLGVALALTIAAMTLPGCSFGKKGPEYQLPNDPVIITSGTYVNPNDDDDRHVCLEYNGRIYVPYGNLDTYSWSHVERTCVGYVTNGDPNDTGDRLLTLADSDDFLMTYYVNGIMDQPMFFRAVDTAGKSIYIPSYISMVNETNDLFEKITQEDWDAKHKAIKQAMKLSGVNFLDGALEGIVDTHGGFHGDGYMFLQLDFSGKEFENRLASAEHWMDLPLSDEMDGLLDSCQYKDGTDAFPGGLQEGKYFFYNRYETCKDRYDEKENFDQYSFNFTICVYDAVWERLYIIVFDT